MTAVELHKCKYCGVETTQPDDECYAKPNKETLEEAARNYFRRGQLGYEKASDTETAFNKGGLWMQERMYSEEEIDKLISDFKHDLRESTSTYVKQNCEGAIFGLNRLKQFKKDNQ